MISVGVRWQNIEHQYKKKGNEMKKLLMIIVALLPIALVACAGCETEPIVEENHKLIVPPNFGAKPAK